MLRGRLACFAAPWESGSHTRHDGGESEDEYESLAGAGVREPSLSSLAAANSGGCVRWTLRGSALRKKPEQVRPNEALKGDGCMSPYNSLTASCTTDPQALDCMVRELDQHEAAATPPPLAVSTEAVAWLLSSRANDQGEEGPILKRILAYCGRVETVRVVERDQRRSHGTYGSGRGGHDTTVT